MLVSTLSTTHAPQSVPISSELMIVFVDTKILPCKGSNNILNWYLIIHIII